ncbi:MAG TPA: hypothetical protein VMX54_06165 [Vicinamibacteria bacterium]|nr:hypothetical protein [Vicinamibacteria bacterium]
MIEVLLMSLAVSGPPADADGRAQAENLARRAVAEALAVGEDAVSVETTEAVDWPDTGLGCPLKGEVNAQVITPGYRVAVRAGGERLEVHVGGGRARVCSARAGPEGSFLAAGVKVAGIARKDLAARLGVEPRQVRLVSLKPTTWPDDTLGCPGSAPSARPEGIKGFLITLRAGEKEYVYHADRERAIACPSE